MDQTWRLGKHSARDVRAAAEQVAARYEGVEVAIEQDGDDWVLCFDVPGEGGQTLEVEVSVYDLGRDGVVLSLEPDSGDNDAAWDDACQLAEDLADILEGEPLDL